MLKRLFKWFCHRSVTRANRRVSPGEWTGEERHRLIVHTQRIEHVYTTRFSVFDDQDKLVASYEVTDPPGFIQLIRVMPTMDVLLGFWCEELDLNKFNFYRFRLIPRKNNELFDLTDMDVVLKYVGQSECFALTDMYYDTERCLRPAQGTSKLNFLHAELCRDVITRILWHIPAGICTIIASYSIVQHDGVQYT